MTAPQIAESTSAGLLARVHALIGPALLECESIFHEELQSPHPYVRECLAHLLSYRGKRLRPLLLLLSAEAAGGICHAHKILAAVVEMIHTATLVHDDVLDDATTRRHVTTVNARWNTETSVLLGDYLFTHAFHLTSSTGSAAACRLIGHATNLVCAGEMMQVGERGNFHLSEEQYLEIVEGKTGELCAVACRLGAQFTDASEPVCQALDTYGRSLGIAFQIADDLLDICGTETATGKTVGSDLKKQKLTLPVIHLLSQLEAPEADAWRSRLQSGAHCSTCDLQTLLEQHGSLEYARGRAAEYVVVARQQLSVLPESPARQLLEDVAEFSMRRTS